MCVFGLWDAAGEKPTQTERICKLHRGRAFPCSSFVNPAQHLNYETETTEKNCGRRFWVTHRLFSQAWHVLQFFHSRNRKYTLFPCFTHANIYSNRWGINNGWGSECWGLLPPVLCVWTNRVRKLGRWLSCSCRTDDSPPDCKLHLKVVTVSLSLHLHSLALRNH